jgi:hypothetical protein
MVQLQKSARGPLGLITRYSLTRNGVDRCGPFVTLAQAVILKFEIASASALQNRVFRLKVNCEQEVIGVARPWQIAEAFMADTPGPGTAHEIRRDTRQAVGASVTRAFGATRPTGDGESWHCDRHR